VCKHRPEQTEEELKLIVDYGVSVQDVIVEHPVYGDLTAPIRVGTRKEVDDFIRKISSTQATYLSQLTGGIHLHTLNASDEDKINDACAALEQAGFLMTD
jgi:transcriptional regulator of NAD metabolism